MKKPLDKQKIRLFDKSFIRLILLLLIYAGFWGSLSVLFHLFPSNYLSQFFFYFVTLAVCPVTIHAIRFYSFSYHEQKRKRIYVIASMGLLIAIIFSWLVALGICYPTLFNLRYYPALATVLIRHDIGINSTDTIGWTPLGVAIDTGNLEAIQLLIDKGANLEDTIDIINYDLWAPDVRTPLGFAIDTGNLEAIQLLIDNGADLEDTITSSDGIWTPLSYAIKKENLPIAQLLIEKGANINSESKWHYRNRGVQRTQDRVLLTPLMLAAKQGLNDMVSLLLKSGADVDRISSDTSSTALIIVCNFSKNVSIETIQLLIDNHANINRGSNSGRNALTGAISEQQQELVRFLIDHGANVNEKNKHSYTILMHTAQDGNDKLARILIRNGADVNAKDDRGFTALMYAKNAEVIKLLLESGAK